MGVGPNFSWLKRMESTDVDLTLMVPCYNEEGNVTGTLETIIQAVEEIGCTYEILVIDDCSADQTSARVEAFTTEYPDKHIRLHRNITNRGLARGFVDGAFMAQGKYYRLVCGDNVEPKETLVAIFREMGNADFIVPYQTSVPGKRLGRRILSRFFANLVNLLSGNSLRYYNGSALFRTFDLMRWHVETTGFGFQAEFITRLLDEGMTYKEVPVEAFERLTGDAKALTLRNWLSAGYSLVKIFLRRMRRVLFDP